MKRVMWAAIYSAGFSAIGASVCLMLWGRIIFPTEGFIMIAPLVVVPGALFGLILGSIGGLILLHLPLSTTRTGFLTSAIILGGILGCVPPIIPRILMPSANRNEILGFLPCVIIGILCAGSWAMLWLRHDRVAGASDPPTNNRR